jgi:Rrf2 family protein
MGYAITALVRLGHSPDALLSTSAIASGGGMPERYLLQVMKRLRDAGLVTSTRGIKGGYRLARPLSRISLQDVFDAIDRQVTEGLPTQGLTVASQRALANVLSDIAEDERRRLGAFTLDSLKANV